MTVIHDSQQNKLILVSVNGDHSETSVSGSHNLHWDSGTYLSLCLKISLSATATN
jgi:hypothetical protein